MQYLFTYLLSIGISFGFVLVPEFKLIKKISNAGYKLNVNRIKEFSMGSKNTLLIMLIPFLNVMYAFSLAIKSIKTESFILDQFSVFGIVEEMTEYEKQKYKKKPTVINALLISIKSEIRLKNAFSVKYKNADLFGEIYYEWDDKSSIDNIIILKTTGNISLFSQEEQKKIILSTYKEIFAAGVKKYGSAVQFLNAIENKKDIDLDDIKEENEASSLKTEISSRERIDILKVIKNDLKCNEEPHVDAKSKKKIKKS